MTCDELSYGIYAPFDWLGSVIAATESTSDLVVALDDCSNKIRDAYANCGGGHGGEGGAQSR